MTVDVEVDNLFGVYGKGIVPLGEMFEVYAMAGGTPSHARLAMAIGVALFMVTMTINVLARQLVWRIGKLTGDAAL
jgi:hypothetical protein